MTEVMTENGGQLVKTDIPKEFAAKMIDDALSFNKRSRMEIGEIFENYADAIEEAKEEFLDAASAVEAEVAFKEEIYKAFEDRIERASILSNPFKYGGITTPYDYKAMTDDFKNWIENVAEEDEKLKRIINSWKGSQTR
jgi:hypothetical protein